MPPTGMRLTDWLRLLYEARRVLAPRDWPMAFGLTLQSAWNELFFHEEQRQLGAHIEQQQPHPPLIICGHWRSGTTHLHKLLAQDERFGFPTYLQVYNPHTFFCMERILKGPIVSLAWKFYGLWLKLAWGSMPKRWDRKIDQVTIGITMPADDEIALQMLKRSPVLPPMLAGLEPRYLPYMSLRELSEAQRSDWKKNWLRFLKKLSLRYQDRPLVLKSNHHTLRLRTILEVFPKVKVIHLHRHPYEVLPSHQRLRRQLEYDRGESLDHYLNIYEGVYSTYLEDRESFPAGQLYEMSYERLIEQPVEELRRAYEALTLPDFGVCRSKVEALLNELEGYQANPSPALGDSERQAVDKRLGRFMDAFGYR